MKKMVIGILTNNRKALLEKTISKLQKYNDFCNFEMVILDNGSSNDCRILNEQLANKVSAKYIYNFVDESYDINKKIEIGHNRLILELLKIDIDHICILEDDWNCTGKIPIDEICCFLSFNTNIGQIRLRDYRYDDSFYGGSSINFITKKKIKFINFLKYGAYNFEIADMHWVNSCTIMKKEVLEKMLFNFEKEIDKMKYFHRLFPLNAQLRPGIFYHSGPQRVRFDLRERGLFRNENIS